jgi:molybdate transport system regulatory protein
LRSAAQDHRIRAARGRGSGAVTPCPEVIRKIEPGTVNAEVTIELAPSLTVVSVITLDATNSLNLKVGDRAYAVIKASSVMVAVD